MAPQDRQQVGVMSFMGRTAFEVQQRMCHDVWCTWPTHHRPEAQRKLCAWCSIGHVAAACHTSTKWLFTMPPFGCVVVAAVGARDIPGGGGCTCEFSEKK